MSKAEAQLRQGRKFYRLLSIFSSTSVASFSPHGNVEERMSSAEGKITPQGADAELTLIGSGCCSVTQRIQLALKLKNLAFNYIQVKEAEEMAASLSPELADRLGPLCQKPPILVPSSGPAIGDPQAILEFLDESFPGGAALLPQSPAGRAVARSWARFADTRLGPAVASVFASSPGDTRASALLQFRSELSLLESELASGSFAGCQFFSGDTVGLLDIVVGCGSYWLPVFEEASGIRLVEPDEFPAFCAWLARFEARDEVRSTAPGLHELRVAMLPPDCAGLSNSLQEEAAL